VFEVKVIRAQALVLFKHPVSVPLSVKWWLVKRAY